MKAKALKATNELTKALEVLAKLLVITALTRTATVTWYNDSDITGLPVDRVASGLVMAVVFGYFVWLHYKKG